jgi:hypothetical protein
MLLEEREDEVGHLLAESIESMRNVLGTVARTTPDEEHGFEQVNDHPITEHERVAAVH